MDPQKDHWLVRPATVRALWRGGLGVLAVLVALDLVIRPEGHFGIDGWPGFAAGYGFAACVGLVAFSKGLGLLLKRRDDHYER